MSTKAGLVESCIIHNSGHLQDDPHWGGFKIKSLKYQFISSGSFSTSRRKWGLLSSSGGSRWVAPASARTSSFSSLKPILQRVKSNKQSTWSGTKFNGASSLDTSLRKSYSKKQLGIGASAGFIGGASYGYGSGLASYSVYHRQKFYNFYLLGPSWLNNFCRYQRYRWYRRHHFFYRDDDYWDDDHYSTYYQR